MATEQEKQPPNPPGLHTPDLAVTVDASDLAHSAFARLPTSVQREAAHRLSAIHAFHALTDSAKKVRLARVARQFNRSAKTIGRWLKQCEGRDAGEWLWALARDIPDASTRAPISRDAYEQIREEYFQLTKPSLRPIYRRVAREAERFGWAVPSYDSVRRRIQAEDRWVRVKRRDGSDALDLMYPTQDRDYSSLRVHERWCGDGRKADLFVRWPDGSISRPIVVAWMDIRTRVLLGYAIGKVESSDLVREALRHAIQRSQRALPESVLVDNGRAFASKQITGGVPNRFRFDVKEEEPLGILPLLGVKTHWAEPYKGRSKPIERFWRTLSEMDKRFPGAYCGNKPSARPEDFDPSKAVPLEKFRETLEETLLDYHTAPHRGDAMGGKSPHALYRELLPLTVPRQATTEQIRHCLYESVVIKPSQLNGSFRIDGNRYWSEALASLSDRRGLIGRRNPEDATEPVAVYRGLQYVCEATLQARTGFADKESAKTHQRERASYHKSRAAMEKARSGMDKALEWSSPVQAGRPASPPTAISVELPAPKIVQPLRPSSAFEPPVSEALEVPIDEFQRAVAVAQRVAKERKAG